MQGSAGNLSNKGWVMVKIVTIIFTLLISLNLFGDVVVIAERRTPDAVEQVSLTILKDGTLRFTANSNWLNQKFPILLGEFTTRKGDALKVALKDLASKKSNKLKSEAYLSPHRLKIIVNGTELDQKDKNFLNLKRLLATSSTKAEWNLVRGIAIKDMSELHAKNYKCLRKGSDNICENEWGVLYY